jgi:Protein of unknown function (DUF4242)
MASKINDAAFLTTLGPISAGFLLLVWFVDKNSRRWTENPAAMDSSLVKTTKRGITMPKFVIERDIPKAGMLSSEQLQAISRKSCEVLREMAAQIQWVHSYVTDDKIYCIYVAPDEDAVRKHAQQGGFPANRISRIRSVIDPTTAE